MIVPLSGHIVINVRDFHNRMDSQRRAAEREAERIRNMEEALSLILSADVIPLPYRKMAQKALGKEPTRR
jgi:hypothetical protein